MNWELLEYAASDKTVTMFLMTFYVGLLFLWGFRKLV